MTHSSPMTFSPSSRRITRSTPCVAGCCGPMLITSSLASRNVLSGVSRSSGESVLGSVIAEILRVPSAEILRVSCQPRSREIQTRPQEIQPQSGDRMRPTACPEPVEGAQAVGETEKEQPAPKGRKKFANRIPLGRPISIQSSLPALDPQINLHPLIILLQDSVILSQRISLPPVGQQNALHVRMPVELNPKHVENFTLQPVGSRPQRNGA